MGIWLKRVPQTLVRKGPSSLRLFGAPGERVVRRSFHRTDGVTESPRRTPGRVETASERARCALALCRGDAAASPPGGERGAGGSPEVL